VWDLPTRLFHWLLAAGVVGSIASAKLGAMQWHFRIGFLVIGLLAFRVLWGLVGGRWSRFASFIFWPGTTWRYVLGRLSPAQRVDIGHSPTGALSVFALLALLLVQAATGLVADDEIANVGPLNRFVAGTTAAAATSWHRGWGQWGLFTLIALHLVAIAGYTVRGQGIVRPMVDGDKALPAGTPASADGLPQRLLALVLAVVCAAGVGWLVKLAG
jgi:cytochrome b